MNVTRRAALLAIALTAGILGGTVTPALADPVTDPAPLTCLGDGTAPDAAVRYRTETVIDAPLSTVWQVQTDVQGWPSWQQPVTSMELLDEGPLRDGSRFRWTTPAPATPTTPASTMVITSTVHQVLDRSCIRWSGPALGEGVRIDNGIHVWNFDEVDGKVRVRTEETWTGAQAEADPALSTGLLGAGLEAWLADLKAAAEARS